VTFKRLFKVKPMTPSYGPLKTIQLLFKTFSPKPPWFRVTSVSQVKWDTLYVYIYIYIYIYIFPGPRAITRERNNAYRLHRLRTHFGAPFINHVPIVTSGITMREKRSPDFPVNDFDFATLFYFCRWPTITFPLMRKAGRKIVPERLSCV